MAIIVFIVISSIILVATVFYANEDIKDKAVQEDALALNDNYEENQKEELVSLKYVALGDSLTEGIGDQEYEDGFAERTSNYLENIRIAKNVDYENYGVSGDTSEDLLSLIRNNTSIRESIQGSDFISITLGGNDLNGAFLNSSGINANSSEYEEAYSEYEQNVDNILSEIESLNRNTVIYFFDLYNPYSVTLEGSEINEVFSSFNDTIYGLEFSNENSRIIEIESLFNYEESSSDESNYSIQDRNHPYLYDKDWFHPNEDGYKLMTSALTDAVIEDINSGIY